MPYVFLSVASGAKLWHQIAYPIGCIIGQITLGFGKCALGKQPRRRRTKTTLQILNVNGQENADIYLRAFRLLGLTSERARMELMPMQKTYKEERTKPTPVPTKPDSHLSQSEFLGIKGSTVAEIMASGDRMAIALLEVGAIKGSDQK